MKNTSTSRHNHFQCFLRNILIPVTRYFLIIPAVFLAFSIAAQSADIIVIKKVNDNTPNVGQVINYEIEIENKGPDDATGLAIMDLLPSGVTFSAITQIPQGTYNPGTGIWDVGTLVDGQKISLKMNVIVDPGTTGQTITNTAMVDAVDQSDPLPGNNSFSVDIIVNSPDIQIVKTVNNDLPNELETVTYTIEVKNVGTANATNLIVKDLLST